MGHGLSCMDGLCTLVTNTRCAISFFIGESISNHIKQDGFCTLVTGTRCESERDWSSTLVTNTRCAIPHFCFLLSMFLATRNGTCTLVTDTRCAIPSFGFVLFGTLAKKESLPIAWERARRWQRGLDWLPLVGWISNPEDPGM